MKCVIASKKVFVRGGFRSTVCRPIVTAVLPLHHAPVFPKQSVLDIKAHRDDDFDWV